MKSNYVLLIDIEGESPRRIACRGFKLTVIQKRFEDETVVCEAEGGLLGTVGEMLKFQATTPYNSESKFTVTTRRGRWDYVQR